MDSERREYVKMLLWGWFVNAPVSPSGAETIEEPRCEDGKSWITRSVPELLLKIITTFGLSREMAKSILVEFALENNGHAVPSSLAMITWTNLEGKRGEKRITEWCLEGSKLGKCGFAPHVTVLLDKTFNPRLPSDDEDMPPRRRGEGRGARKRARSKYPTPLCEPCERNYDPADDLCRACAHEYNTRVLPRTFAYRRAHEEALVENTRREKKKKREETPLYE